MQNKNQKQFAEKRLIFFAKEQVPKISEAEIADVKKHKEEKGPELDTASLVAKANQKIEERSAALSELPPKFLQKMRGEIVRYINASPGRFEKDENKGLSAPEFSAFSSAMVSKVEKLVKDYAPTEEAIAAKKEAQGAAEKASQSAEQVKPVDIKEISEDPGAINDLDTLGAKFNTYNQWNASVQQEASKAMETGGAFQKAYAVFQKARSGVQAYEKLAVFFTGNDPKMQKLRIAQTKALDAVNASLSKINSVKSKLEKYGSKLASVSNRLKQEKIAERDEKIRKIEGEEKPTEEQRRIRQERFALLEKQQKEFTARRDSFVKYGEEVMSKKYKAGEEKVEAEGKKGQLATYQENINKAIERVQAALQDPNISQEHKADLEATLAQLQQKSGEVRKGQEVADKVLEGKSEEVRKWSDNEKALAEKSYNTEQHLQEHVIPAVALMNAQVMRLEEAKMQYATSKEQIIAHYEKAFTKYDEIDLGVDDAVMQNNLANEKLAAALEAQKKSIGSIKLESPGFYESTLGVPFQVAGGAVMAGGEWLLDQAAWLSSSLESARGEMSTFSYVAARIGVEVLSTPIGVAGGLVEMGGGLLTMVGNPAQTATAMGALIGRDPATGEFSWTNAGNAWGEMGKALISYEDFSHGRIGVGVGKLFVNVVTTVTGAAAVSKGGQAAVAAAKAARAAGKGVIASTGAAAKAGLTAGARAAVQAGKEGVIEAGKTAAAMPGKLAAGGKAVAEGARFVAREGVRKSARVAYEAGKSRVAVGIKLPKQLAAELARAPGDYLAMRFEFIGKRFKGARERGLAKSEAKLIDKLEKNSEVYKRFQQEYEKIKKSNPDVTDAEIRYLLAQEDITRYLEVLDYESTLEKMRLTRSKLGKVERKHGRELTARIEKLTQESGKHQEKYKKYTEEMDALAERYPQATHEQLRKKLAENQPELYEAALAMERRLAEIDEAKRIYAATSGIESEEVIRRLTHLEQERTRLLKILSDRDGIDAHAKFMRMLPDTNELKIIYDEFRKVLSEGDNIKIQQYFKRLRGRLRSDKADFIFRALRHMEADFEVSVLRTEALYERMAGRVEAILRGYPEGSLTEERLLRLLDQSIPKAQKGNKRVLYRFDKKGPFQGHICIDEEGRFILVKHKQTDSLVELESYFIDKTTGKLERTADSFSGFKADEASVENMVYIRMRALNGELTNKQMMEAMGYGILTGDEPVFTRLIAQCGSGEYHEIHTFIKHKYNFLTPEHQEAVLKLLLEGTENSTGSARFLAELLDAKKINMGNESFRKIAEQIVLRTLESDPLAFAEIAKHLLDGKIPMNGKIAERLSKTVEGISFLKRIKESKNVRYAPGFSLDDLASSMERMVEHQQNVERILAQFEEIRRTPEIKAEQVAADLREVIELLESDPTIVESNDFARALSRFAEYDPEGFEFLRSIDLTRAYNGEIIESILRGHRVLSVGEDGASIVGYSGRLIGKGGMGEVHSFAFRRKGSSEVEFGARKTTFEHTAQYFGQELEGARLVTSWDHPNIMRAHHIDKQGRFIIYETAEHVMDMDFAMEHLPRSEWFRAVRDLHAALMEYRRRGYFHGDLKEPNVLLFWDKKTQRWEVRLIDNIPVPIDKMIDFEHVTTPVYSLTPHDVAQAFQSIRRDSAREVQDLSSMIKKNGDMKALAQMFLEWELRGGGEVYTHAGPLRHYDLIPEFENHPFVQFLRGVASEDMGYWARASKRGGSSPDFMVQFDELFTQFIDDIEEVEGNRPTIPTPMQM